MESHVNLSVPAIADIVILVVLLEQYPIGGGLFVLLVIAAAVFIRACRGLHTK